jgi:hypothetical protein
MSEDPPRVPQKKNATPSDFFEAIRDSPSFKAKMDMFERSLNSPATKRLSEAIQRLNALPTGSGLNFRVPEPTFALPRDIPEKAEVKLLRDVHAELEGMSQLLAESRLQSDAMVEVTKSNLSALLTVVEELQQTRISSDRSSRRLFWLTVAIFLGTAVGSIGLAANFQQQIGTWVNALRAAFQAG